SYASSVGMQIDDFTLSILLYGAHQEKSARDAENRIRETIADFDKELKGRLDRVVEAATKETAASNAKIAAGLGGEIAKAVDVAVDKAAETRDAESRSRERRAISTAATLCVCGVLAIGGLGYATGYATGRDNAVVTASRFEALSKDPAAGQLMQVVELNDPGVFGSYCSRGSGNLREIEGRLQCTVPLWVSGDSWSAASHMSGPAKRTWATIENWAATSSFWLLLIVG